MLTNLVNMVNTVFQAPQATQPVMMPKQTIENPFATPFATAQTKRQLSFGKNRPVQGGYFAGYHNGQQNIVGRRLFIDA